MSQAVNDPIGTVLAVRHRDALVRVDSEICPRCAAGKGCGAGLFGQSKARVELTLPIADGLEIAVGERVTLSLKPSDLARAALFLYGLPLGGLLLASGLAFLVLEDPSDATALAWASVGLATGIVAGGVRARRDPCLSRLRPTISGRAGDGSGGAPS